MLVSLRRHLQPWQLHHRPCTAAPGRTVEQPEAGVCYAGGYKGRQAPGAHASRLADAGLEQRLLCTSEQGSAPHTARTAQTQHSSITAVDDLLHCGQGCPSWACCRTFSAKPGRQARAQADSACCSSGLQMQWGLVHDRGHTCSSTQHRLGCQLHACDLQSLLARPIPVPQSSSYPWGSAAAAVSKAVSWWWEGMQCRACEVF